MSRRDKLAHAHLYLCVDGRADKGDLPDFLDAVLGAGVDIVQLRQKGLEARHELSLLAVFEAACRRHDALLSVNDRADLAYAAGADVLHLGQDDLPVAVARRLVGSDVLIGRSTHSPAQIDEALADPDVDYFCVGPCWPTPTKPGRPAAGLEVVRYAASRASSKPWFAIGGITTDNLDVVLEAGARRVVVVRALTEAADPASVAAELASRLAKWDRGALDDV
ncbi:MAG: thiamine phosphate synthase [Acidothermus sp.]|nr:thiamine phosphate synthase [Acidothermus sp.]